LKTDGLLVTTAKIEQRFISRDGTIRYLIGFADGQTVETVWMPEGDDGEAGDGSEAGEEELSPVTSRKRSRATICVSSQVGCAVNCRFCMTALLGLKRNLTAGEIVGQITAVLNDHDVDLQEKRVNIVFMGQGEPFNNYDQFMKAVRLLVEGVGIAESRMTVSTSGIAPRIYDLGKETIRPKLAISLNASNDDERTKLIPINKKWDIKALVEAAKAFPLRRRENITFEYVLLAGENDSVENAKEVIAIVESLGDLAPRVKINLIAWNSGPEIPFHTPEDSRVHAFQKTIRSAGIPAFIRRPRGRDIYAACGQLKRIVTIQPAAI
jgi:23S rRNA (adenine2503-C2)-methyltransferase